MSCQRLLIDIMLSGLQNGIQWEIMGGILCFILGVLWWKLGIPVKMGYKEGFTSGNGIFVVLLLQIWENLVGVNNYVSLAIWGKKGIINRTLANRLSKSWQSPCDHNGREMVDQSYGIE